MIGIFVHSNQSTGKVMKRAYAITDILKSPSSNASFTTDYQSVK